MKLSEKLSLWQYITYTFSSIYDRPVLRIIESIGAFGIVIFSLLQQGLFWLYFLTAIVSIFLILIIATIIYCIASFSAYKSKDKTILKTITISEKTLIISFGEEKKDNVSRVAIEKVDTAETWFVGRSFYVKRKYLAYRARIAKSDMEEFKKYVEKHGWNIRPSFWVGRYILRIFASILIITVLIFIPSEPLVFDTDKQAVVVKEDETPLTPRAVIDEVNRVRAEKNLPAYRENPTLNETASIFCKEMETDKFFDHVNPKTNRDGYELIIEKFPDSDVYQLLLSATPTKSNPIKNIIGVWQQDKFNRVELLSETYSNVGAAVCDYTINEEYTRNVVVHLAS